MILNQSSQLVQLNKSSRTVVLGALEWDRKADFSSGAYLSLTIFATISLDHCESAKSEQVSKGFHFQ
jgi:hypothetical protein